MLLFSLAAAGARGWAGAVLSMFPVQTLGELRLGRGEVISCSNCKVDCNGGGVAAEGGEQQLFFTFLAKFPIRLLHAAPWVRQGKIYSINHKDDL